MRVHSDDVMEATGICSPRFGIMHERTEGIMLCKKEGFFCTYTHCIFRSRRFPSDTGFFFLLNFVEFGRHYSVFWEYEGSTEAIIEGRSRANRNEDPAPGRVLSLFWRKL